MAEKRSAIRLRLQHNPGVKRSNPTWNTRRTQTGEWSAALVCRRRKQDTNGEEISEAVTLLAGVETCYRPMLDGINKL